MIYFRSCINPSDTLTSVSSCIYTCGSLCMWYLSVHSSLYTYVICLLPFPPTSMRSPDRPFILFFCVPLQTTVIICSIQWTLQTTVHSSLYMWYVSYLFLRLRCVLLTDLSDSLPDSFLLRRFGCCKGKLFWKPDFVYHLWTNIYHKLPPIILYLCHWNFWT